MEMQQSRSNNREEGFFGVNDFNPERSKQSLPHTSYRAEAEAEVEVEVEEEDVVSDCESSTSSSSSSSSAAGREMNSSLFGSGTVRLDKKEAVHNMISRKFMTDLAGLGMRTNIEAIHRYENTNLTRQAKLAVFLKLLKATEEKNGGVACWKYAWYCGSKQDVNTILSYGFGHAINNGIYGRGIYLSAAHHPLQSLHSSIPDEDGLRHLLLCRVILGNMELVSPGSEQCHPSSEEFDSGVDNLLLPTKYIIWSTHMNTHILPEFVVSIRAPPITKGNSQFSVPLKKPSSPWVPLSMLISILSKYLPPKSIKRIQKYHTDYKEGRIVRQEMIKQVRRITGDILLFGVIKAYSEQFKTSMGNKSHSVSPKCQ